MLRRAFIGSKSPVSPTTPSGKKAKKAAEALALVIGYPVFERNRCTVTIEHGNPSRLAGEAKRTRSYLVASDLSTEAEYALQWAIGTCVRQGDLLHVVSVMESESRLDHEITSISGAGDLKAKQRERLDRVQALQRIIVSLLERTRLHGAASTTA